VIYTNPNKVKLAVISTSPDQQLYEDPARAWRRILQHPTSPTATQPTLRDYTSTPVSPPNSKSTNRKRGRPSGSTNKCSKPKALRRVKARRMELTPSLHNTETESQLHLNKADILSCNTATRNDKVSNQHKDNTFQMYTTSDKDCNMELTDTHQDTNTELKVPYSDTVDHQTTATEAPSSTRTSDLCTQLHHIEQNNVMRSSQNNQYMSDTDTQVQQFNQADHMNHHANHTNNSNRLNKNTNHYHDTALSSSRDSKTSLHTNPTAQISGGNEYNMHWKPTDNIRYNTKPAQKGICPDNVHWPYTEDTILKDMTTTVDLSAD
jgi:hypothetical protein